jgi:HK97 family phage major capsid protein
MGKKFIVIAGKKHYLEDEDDAQTGSDAGVADESADDASIAPTEEEVNDAAEKAAEKVASIVGKKLGLDSLLEKVDGKIAEAMKQPENAKLKEILHGKDLFNDKDQLTAEEKIVGFFHGLVTQNHAVLKALAEGTNADGGYLFPAEFLAELVKSLTAAPRMRSLVRVIPMRRNVINASSLLTRPKVYWTAENAAKTTTTATFGQPTLTARKAAAIIYSSDELIEDSTEFDVVRLIIDLFAEAIGIEEDRVILRGNGTTEPTGIETARAASTFASRTCSGNLDFDDILDLVYDLKPQYRTGASFLVHPTNVKELRKLKDNNGRYLYEDSRVSGQPAALVGYQVNEFYDVPEGTIYFGNWKLAYWLGDRSSMAVKISNDTETAFTKDQTAIRVVFRIGGAVVLGDAAKALISIP